ncbi:MAG: 50S ribosomal protein L13 [Candidatus Omnitrophota bacterium]
MKTMMVNNKGVNRKWHLIDANDRILGRLATEIASLLKGKGKADITPHVDCGDGVVVINAEKISVTGKKMSEKKYKRYSGYPGGLTEEPLEHLLVRRPTQVLMHAVKGMLPKNKLGKSMIGRLKIYAGDKHRQAAQLNAGKAAKAVKEVKEVKEAKEAKKQK